LDAVGGHDPLQTLVAIHLAAGIHVKESHLGAKGLEQVIEITLTAEERIALQKSAASVEELVDVLGI